MAQTEDKSWDFDKWADRFDEIVARGETYYRDYGAVLDEVVAAAALQPGNLVLDIGTGTGNLAMRCARTGARVIGVDPSERMLEKARHKLQDGLDIEYRRVDAPFKTVPPADGGYDAAVSSYAFHHVPREDHAESIRIMLDALSPGGRWVLGDIMFEDAGAEAEALRALPWLEKEFFARIDEIRAACKQLDIPLGSKQMTPWTWVLYSVKSR